MFLILICVALLVRAARKNVHAANGRQRGNGVATRSEIKRAAGRGALLRRAEILRPSLDRARACDVGVKLGYAQWTGCWASVEDSILVLGPPRSGKGLHLVIPAILEAPGAVVTTSTRPDNLTATAAARAERGPVAVFDPQGLARAFASTTRWSPTRGCASPRIAIARASALCANPGHGVENSAYWTQQCHTAVRCLLHAAAVADRPTADLFRWSVSAVTAQEAVEILASHPQATPSWNTALDAILSSDARQRDATWSMVAGVFAPLADPDVLAALSPAPGAAFEPAEFLRSCGTLYLLGTSAGAAATATLVSALVDDIADVSRTMAAASAGARLDPPLSLILDEAANYPLTALPSLMSDGGGSGISTTVVLQSLAQARARWGEHNAQAIWDAAIVKLILGGCANAGDLRDLSALMGTRQQLRITTSWGADGRSSTSRSPHDVPVIDASRIRTLGFGRAILLLRSAPPIVLTLRPWTHQSAADQISAWRDTIEERLRTRLQDATSTPALRK